MWRYFKKYKLKKRGLKIIVMAPVIIICLITAFSVIKAAILEKATPPLIRLHVIANSDSQHDQELKLLVRDQIVRAMSERLRDCGSLEESRDVVLDSLDKLTAISTQTLRDAGCQDDVRAYYGDFAFPTRYYGELSLPAGTYEALRIVIGEGKGANWWCVLFPPLCFVGSHPQGVPGDSPGQQSLTTQHASNVKIKPALKIVELLLK